MVEHLESRPEQFRRSVERLGMMESDLDRVCFAAELLAHVQPMPIYRDGGDKEWSHATFEPPLLAGGKTLRRPRGSGWRATSCFRRRRWRRPSRGTT